MESTTVQIKIPTAKYKLLEDLASKNQRVVSDILDLALAEWLEREIRLQKAREIMRQLGEGQPPHDAARNHDVYLYGKSLKKTMVKISHGWIARRLRL